MSQNAMKRLYLMQVGSMPHYQIPIVCYLVQTGDGKHMLIDVTVRSLVALQLVSPLAGDIDDYKDEYSPLVGSFAS